VRDYRAKNDIRPSCRYFARRLSLGGPYRARPCESVPDRIGRTRYHAVCIRGDGRAYILSAYGARVGKRTCYECWHRTAFRRAGISSCYTYAFVEGSRVKSTDPLLEQWRIFAGALIQY